MTRPLALASIVGAVIFGAMNAGCSQDSNQLASTSSGAGGAGGGAAGSGSSGHGGAATSGSSTGSSGSNASSSGSMPSSSSGSNSSSGSSSGMSSSSGMTENCTNGVDDDGNGMIDCADPACAAGYTCTPNPPAGWLGPVALYNGPPANKPMCPPEHPTTAYQGNTGIIDTPAMCSACTCSNPTVTCTPSAVELDSDAMCTTMVGSLVQGPMGLCSPILPPGTTVAAKAPVPTGTASACIASQAMATLPPPQWMTAGLACAGGGIGAGCPAKNECVPKAMAPFEATLCVWHATDIGCPADYPNKFLYDDSVLDMRGCSQCTCGAGVPTCAATTKLYSGPNCSGNVDATIPNDGTCVAVAGGGGKTMDVTITKSGSCPPAGGQPTGMITAGAVHTTVCCAN